MIKKLFLLVLLTISAINLNAQITSVALVGEAAGGWPTGAAGEIDVHQMTSTDGENWTLNAVTLTTFATGGGIKFRANNAWDINWGSTAFPSGTGTLGGANIQCIAGTYDVTFNSTTGVYNFSGGTPLPVVKLVGSAVTTPGGLVLNVTGADTFSVSNSTLAAGNAQFEVDGVLYGGITFPTGSALSNTDLIPVPAAFFSSISINIATGDYTFVLIPPVSIVGDGVGGWPPFQGNDPNQLTSSNGVNYSLDKLACIVGPAKFRQDNAWAISWSDVAFPTGIATSTGADIAITTAGTYDVRFNRVNGEYSFSIPTIALVGQATPTGWPQGGVGEIDPTVLTTTDGITYMLNNLTLTAGECKFRTNNAWAVNFGNAAFPIGTATQGGDNIIVTGAGTYNVTLNRVTGEYSFLPSVASVSQFGNKSVNVYPNPTNNVWNFASTNNTIDVITIADISGKIIFSKNVNALDFAVNAASFSSGIYFATVKSGQNAATYKLVKN